MPQQPRSKRFVHHPVKSWSFQLLLVNLADEYRQAGKEDEARRTYQTVLKKDPTNERTLDGLSRLPDRPLEGLALVNFTSEAYFTINVSAGGPGASNTVDGNPNSAWVSGSGDLPQTLIFALPAHASISEISFNNPGVRGSRPKREGYRDLGLSSECNIWF